MSRTKAILDLALALDRARAEGAIERLADGSGPWAARPPQDVSKDAARAVAVLLATVYPSLATAVFAEPEIAESLVAEGFHVQLDRDAYLARLRWRTGDVAVNEHAARDLRRAVRDEKIRIALREALPLALGGADVDVTAHEHTCLAEAAIEIALAEAVHTMAGRYGPPRTASGEDARFVVLGQERESAPMLEVKDDSVGAFRFFVTYASEAVSAAKTPLTVLVRDLTTGEVSRHDTVFSAPR